MVPVRQTMDFEDSTFSFKRFALEKEVFSCLFFIIMVLGTTWSRAAFESVQVAVKSAVADEELGHLIRKLHFVEDSRGRYRWKGTPGCSLRFAVLPFFVPFT